jgi:hypothetical protein
MSTRQVDFNSVAPHGRITGVTTRSGREIPFTRDGASITNDTLHAQAQDGSVALPSDSIAQLWTRKISPVKTAGLVGGLAAALVLAAGIAVASSGLNFGP